MPSNQPRRKDKLTDPFADVIEENHGGEAAVLAPTVNPEGGTRVGITLKGGAAFEAPWLTPSYPSWAAAAEDLSDPDTQKNIVSVMANVAKINAAFVAKVSGSAPARPVNNTGSDVPTRPGQEPPAGAPPAPGPDWAYKTGIKNDKTWQGWFPPRGSEAKPVWF